MESTSHSAAPKRFVGWRIVAIAAIALGLSGPGQTVGVSVFVDPMMDALSLTRSQVSLAYLIGTLIGAAALPHIGTRLDRHGTRASMAVIGMMFGMALIAMSTVTGFVTITLGFIAVRMLGQGGMSLVSINAVAPWFDRRRGVAIGLSTAAGSAVMSLIPIISAWAITGFGWRAAWVALGVLVWLVITPLALLGMIDRPGMVGQAADGDAIAAPRVTKEPQTVRGYRRDEALRLSMFWSVGAAVAATGLITTALAFHQIDLLGERGLTTIQAAANFLPQTLAALGATLLVGSMIDRLDPRLVVIGSMALLAAALVAINWVRPGWPAVAYGIAVGSSGAAARTLEAAAFPKLFGIRHLGAIRGVVIGIGIAATAVGPLALSAGYNASGSYTATLRWWLIIPIVVAAAAVRARIPDQPPAHP